MGFAFNIALFFCSIYICVGLKSRLESSDPSDSTEIACVKYGGVCSYEGLRLSTIPIMALHGNIQQPDRDIYEFGVLTGKGIGNFIKAAKWSALKFDRLRGFDSFSGFPSEISTDSYNPWIIAGGKRAKPGDASMQKLYSSRTNMFQSIRKNIGYEKTDLVEGFYNESLTDTLKDSMKMKPALYVDIDCDLYISTYQALDWMFKNGLMAGGKHGTYVYYDDTTDGSKENEGEMGAHHDISKKYNVKWQKLTPLNYFWQVKKCDTCDA